MSVYWNPSTNTYSEGKTDYVAEQQALHPKFSDLPEAAQKSAIDAWKAEAPKDDAETVTASVEEVRSATKRAASAKKITDAALVAKKTLTIEVLKSWSVTDAEKVVGRKTVTQAGGATKESDLTALEQLRDAAGLLGWPTLLGWIADKREGASSKVKDTKPSDWTAVDGVDGDLVTHVLKLARA